MLLIYRLSDGVILDNSGTNSAAPMGLPVDDTDAWRLNLRGRGVTLKSVGFLRLHDVDQAGLVARTFEELHHVDVVTGALVFDGPKPAPVVEPAPPSALEQLDALREQLVAKGTITRAEADNTRARRQTAT